VFFVRIVCVGGFIGSVLIVLYVVQLAERFLSELIKTSDAPAWLNLVDVPAHLSSTLGLVAYGRLRFCNLGILDCIGFSRLRYFQSMIEFSVTDYG